MDRVPIPANRPFLFICVPCLSPAWSQATSNLSQQGWYADPEIRVFAGEYWIYPTSSGHDRRESARDSHRPDVLRCGRKHRAGEDDEGWTRSASSSEGLSGAVG